MPAPPEPSPDRSIAALQGGGDFEGSIEIAVQLQSTVGAAGIPKEDVGGETGGLIHRVALLIQQSEGVPGAFDPESRMTRNVYSSGARSRPYALWTKPASTLDRT